MGLIEGLASRLFKGYLEKLETSVRKTIGTEVNAKILDMVQGRPVYPPDNIETYINNGYLFNPIVYSIVSFIAQKAGSIPWGVYEVKDEKSLNLYKSATKWDFNSKIVRTKALVALPDHDLNELFVRPNELQGWADYFEQVVGFKLVTGDSYIHAIGPTAGVNKGAVREMWSLPPQIIKPVAGSKSKPVIGYKYLNEEELIPPEEIIHLKYWTPEYYNGAFLYGLSPIRAAKRVMTKSNASFDSMTSSFQNMGAVGILSPEGQSTDMLTEEQIEMLEQRYRRKTGPKNRGVPLFSEAPLKWQQIGMSPADLSIIESDKMDLRTICNIYHVPSELFNDASNKTYSNTKEAGSAVYTNAVLPQLNQFRDAFNQFIDRRQPGNNIYIDYDASMISELQDDIGMIANALQTVWYLTPNEKRDMLNFPADENNPMMEDYWVPMGLSPMSSDTLNDQALEEVEKRLQINDYRPQI